MTKIEFERRKANLTQKQLANMIGVTDSAVCYWETHTTTPNVNYIEKMAAVLNVPYDRLIGDVE